MGKFSRSLSSIFSLILMRKVIQIETIILYFDLVITKYSVLSITAFLYLYQSQKSMHSQYKMNECSSLTMIIK